MRFQVIGADKETGEDVNVTLVASTRAVAEHDAAKRGIMVSAINEIPEVKEIIELEPEPAAALEGAAKDGAPRDGVKHGRITLSANSPSESGFSGEAGQRQSKDTASALEYHVIMNQALYLLETAVNKHLKEGWEPAGGLAVGISNNALQYFQAVTRRHPPGMDGRPL